MFLTSSSFSSVGSTSRSSPAWDAVGGGNRTARARSPPRSSRCSVPLSPRGRRVGCWLSCLDLLHLDHMTQCHVSFAMSSFIITCVSFATSPSHFHLHGICCSYTCTCGLITCVSHINTISPPKLSLNYQNQTRTFQSGFLSSSKPGGCSTYTSSLM